MRGRCTHPAFVDACDALRFCPFFSLSLSLLSFFSFFVFLFYRSSILSYYGERKFFPEYTVASSGTLWMFDVKREQVGR